MSIPSDIPGTVYTCEWDPANGLHAPKTWPDGQTVKVSDIFDELNHVACVNAIKTIAGCPSHTFVVITKNPVEANEVFKHCEIRQPRNLVIVISRDCFNHAFAEVSS